jgi:predicted Zn-ribbon and HTH transcriptional regulator
MLVNKRQMGIFELLHPNLARGFGERGAGRSLILRVFRSVFFILDSVTGSRICSHEHETAITSYLGAHIAQIVWQTATAGVEVMDSTLKPLKAALEKIREMASNALDQIEQSQETRSMRWICKECRYVKRFTKPLSLETAGRCPRCKSTAFNPIL